MKTTPWLVAGLLILLAATDVAAENSAGESEEAAAVVNGTAISVQTLDRRVEQLKPRFFKPDEQESPQKLIVFRAEILKQLIAEELLYQESRRQGKRVETAAVDEEMARMKGRFPDQGRYQQALAKMGTDENQLRMVVERSLIIRTLVNDEVVNAIEIPEADSRKFYQENSAKFERPEQVHARHILIKVDPAADDAKKEAAKKRIEQIRKRLTEGKEDFASVAREVSEGPSGKEGGDLGFFGRGRMVKPFEETAFGLKVGSLSQVVETRFGYHLIEVTERRPASTASFDKTRQSIETHLKNERARQEVRAYIDKLRSQAEIETR